MYHKPFDIIYIENDGLTLCGSNIYIFETYFDSYLFTFAPDIQKKPLSKTNSILGLVFKINKYYKMGVYKKSNV